MGNILRERHRTEAVEELAKGKNTQRPAEINEKYTSEGARRPGSLNCCWVIELGLNP